MRRYLTALLAVALFGCASQPQPTPGDSVIVFIVPSMTSESGQYQPTYGDAPTLSLHDVTGGARKIVAVLTVGNKVGYRVPPGKYEFMVANRYSTDFMEASVAGGKTYYAILQLQGDGSYSQRYGFRPVRAGDFDSGAFRRWDSNTHFVKRPAKWRAWEIDNEESLDKRLREHRPAWDKQSPAERRLRTIQVSDGR
jgi:hypothetical protein